MLNELGGLLLCARDCRSGGGVRSACRSDMRMHYGSVGRTADKTTSKRHVIVMMGAEVTGMVFVM